MTADPVAWEDPREVRAAIRAGAHVGPTYGLAPEYVQTNLAIVPGDCAEEMADLCARNPVPCALVETLAPGAYEPVVAPGADLRTDLPQYRVYRKGVLLEKRHEIVDLWRSDFVAFLIGCSYTFEHALIAAGLEVRHQRLGRTVPMYRTSLRLAPAGRFFGHMIVSMRPFKAEDVQKVRAVTRPYRRAHGEPIHWGDPSEIGIRRLDRPDEGEAVPVEHGEVPVFWGCGVTPQQVAIESRIPYIIVHEPGHMFVTDLPHEELVRSKWGPLHVQPRGES
ncbi:MAG: putative hydro-lyase [Candidatus Eremiobacteraeota bacterium]|nr:putative hydro-lyase [Candidatus Eremiobacteraeota bacterium]